MGSRQQPVKGRFTYGLKFLQPYPKTAYFLQVGLAGKPHLGVDYIQTRNSPIYAIADGVITLAKDAPQGGLTLHQKTSEGHLVRYMHLERFYVQEGASVRAGDVVGFMGSTGAGTGVHLHLDVWTTGKIDLVNRKGLVDPEGYIAESTPMVTKENANGILFWLDGKTDHGADSQALADALNKGDQGGKAIIDKYLPSKEKAREEIKAEAIAKIKAL